MIRALTTIAAVAALAVSAAPVASAGTPKAKAPPVERAERVTAFVWLAELSPVVTHKPKPRGLSIASSEVFELNTAHKRPKAMGTRSGGEVVSDFAKAPAGMRLTAIKDGTSNTIMWSGSLKPPNGIIAILIG